MNWSGKRLWLSVVFFLLLLGSLIAAGVLVQKKQLTQKGAAGEQARLELPSSRSVQVNQQFSVPIMVNTDGVSIIGADIVLTFDKSLLQLVDLIPHPENSTLKTFAPLDENGNFKKQEVINQANQTGTIEFGAVAFNWANSSTLAGFNGVLGPTNPLATLKFKALAPGQTTVKFEFTPDSTTDSNLVKEAETVDILSKTTDLSLTITTSTTITPAPECKEADDCDDNNPCTTDLCENNQCQHWNLADGVSCDQSDPSKICLAGQCIKPDCQPGERDCGGLGNRPRVCGPNYQWQLEPPCASGEVCQNGECIASDQSQCSSCPEGVPPKSQGNANCDGNIDLDDYLAWRLVYRKLLLQQPVSDEAKATVDFNCQEDDSEHVVNLQDFLIWKQEYQKRLIGGS